MRKFFAGLILAVLSMTASAQSTQLEEGSCVMGVTKKVNGQWVFSHPINVYRNPTDRNASVQMQYFDAYYISSVVNGRGRVQLTYAPGFDPHPQAGQIYGWVEQQDIRAYDYRNCE